MNELIQWWMKLFHVDNHYDVWYVRQEAFQAQYSLIVPFRQPIQAIAPQQNIEDTDHMDTEDNGYSF